MKVGRRTLISAEAAQAWRRMMEARCTRRPGPALAWCHATFGDIALDPLERAMRFVEESIELAHAIGLPADRVAAIIARVYTREKGDKAREVGQAQLTLELLAEALALDAQQLAAAEFARVQAIPRTDWVARHQAKVETGIALPAAHRAACEGCPCAESCDEAGECLAAMQALT